MENNNQKKFEKSSLHQINKEKNKESLSKEDSATPYLVANINKFAIKFNVGDESNLKFNFLKNKMLPLQWDLVLEWVTHFVFFFFVSFKWNGVTQFVLFFLLVSKFGNFENNQIF